MASEFDRLMAQADNQLFEVFGETCGGQPTYTPPNNLGPTVYVDVMVDKNVQVAGADGIFRPVQYLASLRLCQVRAPRAGGLLVLPAGRYLLEERQDSDGLVERWSLMPQR